MGGAVVVSGVPPVESRKPWPLDADVGEVHGQLNAGLQHRQAVASVDKDHLFMCSQQKKLKKNCWNTAYS